MSLGVPPESLSRRIDKAIAPGTAFCFSVLVAFLEPRYLSWYGSAMPALTAKFITAYPLWVAVTALGVVVQITRWLYGMRGATVALLEAADLLLAAVSVLVITVGIIALALPLLTLQLPL